MMLADHSTLVWRERETEMEAALLSGFIKTILPRLFSLVEGKYKLHKGLKSDIKSLEKELRMIAVTIDEQISLGRKDQGAVLSLSVDELRELAHQIEDCVDRFLYHVTREQQASLFRRTIRSPKTLLSRQRLAAEVQVLKKIPEEAHQREKRYRVFSGLSSSTRHAESSSCSSGSDPHTLKADIIGIDGPRDELVQLLAEEAEGLAKQLKVISIVGIHGSGKTVLAREVYESDVGRQFSLRAWVSATDRGPREVLMEILQEIGRPVLDNSSVDQLTVDLRKHLGEQR
jgi:disease resistance protein RPM1